MTAANDPPVTPASQTPGAGSVPAHTANPPGNSGRVTASTAAYVTRPTRWTLFMRTFIPWQLWRFARINLKMFGIIFRSRR